MSAYNLVAITPAIDALVLHFYEETTGSYWPPERALLEANYRAIAFPFPEREVPKFELCADWTLDQLLGYLRTWSATKRFMSEKGYDPVDSLDEEIRQYWQDPEQSREVRWPLLLRVFQNVP